MHEHPANIVTVLLWEFGGNREAARRYCERIASRNGEHANDYREAARLLAQQPNNN